MTNKFSKKIARGITRIFLIIWTMLVVFPLVWLLYSSLKTNKEFYKDPWALPEELHLENYSNAWVSSHISGYFLNSLILVAVSLLLVVLLSAATAYVLAKHTFFIENLLTFN